jgi:splicing factor 3B subunit 3
VAENKKRTKWESGRGKIITRACSNMR